MKLFLEHTFDVTPAEYAELYFDEPFQNDLCASVRLGRTVLRLDRTPDRIVRHVRCEPIRDVPAPLAKLLEGHRFHYVEELDFDLTKLHARWRVVPSMLPEKVEAKGTLDFEGVGGDGESAHGAARSTRGTKRVVRGEVNVSVFGVGGIVERFVVGEVERSYDDASAFTRSYLERRRG